jgi:hypothetical protein
MKGFDALEQVGDRHYLSGLGRWLSRRGNNAYVVPIDPNSRRVSGKMTGGILRGGIQDPLAKPKFGMGASYAGSLLGAADIHSPDEAEDAGYQPVDNPETDCDPDEAIANLREHCPDLDSYHAWVRMCYATIHTDGPDIHADHIEPPCFWPTCTAEQICYMHNCKTWGIRMGCCPCNVCPEIGEEMEFNGRPAKVIQTNICPGDYVIQRVYWCDDFSPFCIGVGADLPMEIVSALLLLIQTGVDMLAYHPCPNIIGSLLGSGEMQGIRGNILVFEGCLHCQCCAVSTGFYIPERRSS